MHVVREGKSSFGRLGPLGIGAGVTIFTTAPTVHWLFYAKLQSSRVALKILYPFPILLSSVEDMNGREWWLFTLVLSQFLVYGAIIALGNTRAIQVRFTRILMTLHTLGASALVYHEYFLS